MPNSLKLLSESCLISLFYEHFPNSDLSPLDKRPLSHPNGQNSSFLVVGNNVLLRRLRKYQCKHHHRLHLIKYLPLHLEGLLEAMSEFLPNRRLTLFNVLFFQVSKFYRFILFEKVLFFV